MDRPTLIRRRLPQLFAALSATLGAFCLGTVLGWTSPASPMLQEDLDLSEATVSWCGGIMPLGALCAMLTSMVVLDRVGRRLPLLVLAPPFVGGWALLAFLDDAAWKLIGRFITGFCGGAFCTGCPVYTGEIAEKEIRGALGVCFQFMITSGILFVYVVGKYTDLLWLSMTCAIPPIVFFVLFFFVPESPMFLLSQDKTERATASLKWLRGGENADIGADLANMTETVAHAKARQGTLKDMFTSVPALRGLGIGLGLQFCQQLSGINVIIFYSVDIFKDAGSDIQPIDCAIIVAIVQVLATFLSTMLVECAGRRVWMMLSMAGMGTCLTLMGVYFYWREHHPDTASSMSWLPLMAICLYLVFFSIGAGPIPWLIIGEIFPGEIKGIAASICGGTNWLLAFIVSKTYADLVGVIGSAATFWLYSAICILGVVFVFFCVLETRNKTLDEITKELIGD